ncbi:hypothetical protein [Burkholderia multivorans]|uniref:hypothetical protein n=1 Tax=Burkholderia multivorans TaxID=87883 RepID=UPI001E373685|nr:hypothetical protein [Burkholderia multivorans]
MKALRRAAVLAGSVDHAKLMIHCHLCDDIHVILFRLVLVQNTSRRRIRWTSTQTGRGPVFRHRRALQCRDSFIREETRMAVQTDRRRLLKEARARWRLRRLVALQAATRRHLSTMRAPWTYTRVEQAFYDSLRRV